MKDAILAFDLGGTNLKYGIGSLDGNILYHSQRYSGGKGSIDLIIETFAAAAGEMQALAVKKRLHLAAAGVGTPGAVNPVTGDIFGSSPNIPALLGAPLKKLLEERLKMPVAVDNDANFAVLGEAVLGAGKEYRSTLGLTLGTGVGGGYVQDGVIFKGDHGSAMEAGHITIVMNGRICSCGKPGHLEAYSSGSAIVKRANELGLERNVPSPLHFDRSKPVFQAADDGYEPAIQAVKEAVEALAAGLSSLINTFDPGCVVIGGGVMFGIMKHWQELEERVRNAIIDSLTHKIPLIPAQLGNMAGMAGAVIAAAKKLKGE